MKKFALVLLTIALGFIALPVTALAATKTLENLQTAFNGESNAKARYLPFAEKADQEGYGEDDVEFTICFAGWSSGD